MIRAMSTPQYGSLFSGVGGFDLGFDRAGYECAFQVEWDPHCQEILKRHWSDVPRYSDIREVDGSTIPPCDVLIFGSPCQDLSHAGKRAGLEGSKSSMFFEAIRIIKEMRESTQSIFPRVTVWENVAGALSSNGGHDFGQVLNQMADIGALEQEWSVLDASKFGVPQRRRRLFLISIFDPASAQRCPNPLLPFKPSGNGNTQAGRPTKQKASNGDEVLPRKDCLPIAFSHTQGLDCQPSSEHFPTLRREGSGHAVIISDGESETVLGRRLLPVECERLQGWKDNHTLFRADGTEQGDSQRYKQCGNGVASPVAEWIAKKIKVIL